MCLTTQKDKKVCYRTKTLNGHNLRTTGPIFKIQNAAESKLQGLCVQCGLLLLLLPCHCRRRRLHATL